MSHTERSTTPTQATPPTSASTSTAAPSLMPSTFHEPGSVITMTASPFERTINRHPALPSTSTSSVVSANKEERARIKMEKEQLRAQSDYNQMEADRITEENLDICRRYFIIGCFGLPWVHFMTVWYFFREIRGQYVNLKIRQYIFLSIIVGFLQTFALILWFIIYQIIGHRFSALSILSTDGRFVGFFA